jgi:hypothetical protein
MIRLYKVVVELDWAQTVALRHESPEEFIIRLAKKVSDGQAEITCIPCRENERVYEVAFIHKQHLDTFCVLFSYSFTP